MPRLKFITYNIHSGIGRDRKYDLARTIKTIENENPDIIALQEVDKNLRRSDFDDQSQILADHFDMHYHHCVNRYIDKGEYGITTLSRFPITHQKRHELTYRLGYEPRGTLRTDLLIDGNEQLHVFNVHLGLGTRERHYQKQRLISESILLNEELHHPVVVLGDFNDRPISVVHRRLREHFVDVVDLVEDNPQFTFKWGPVKIRLDHIYVSSQLKPLEARVVKTPYAHVASDHLPLATVVQV